MSRLRKQRIYKKAFAIISRVNRLLLKARDAHEKSIYSEDLNKK